MGNKKKSKKKSKKKEELSRMHTKSRREVEVYDHYWKFTAAHLNILGTKFNNCLKVIVLFIDQHRVEIQENTNSNRKFSETDLYLQLQEKIVVASSFKGKDATLSARKVINQFVKIGFVNPFLAGYHKLVGEYVKATSDEQKTIIFSKIFYESASLASDVTVDNRGLKHVAFLLQTLERSGPLTKKDIIALMVTDIQQYKGGYLTRQVLDCQYQYAMACEFQERKYNQIAHLIGYLKRFVDLQYDAREEKFWFKNDIRIAEVDFEQSYARDGVKHRIYKDELKEESKRIYGDVVCYFDKLPYKSVIASHIKPCIDCLREHKEEEAYDVYNGLLLNPIIDSYFDKKDISFTDEGYILIGKQVNPAIAATFKEYHLDENILTKERKVYLQYHRKLFEEKNGR